MWKSEWVSGTDKISPVKNEGHLDRHHSGKCTKMIEDSNGKQNSTPMKGGSTVLEIFSVNIKPLGLRDYLKQKRFQMLLKTMFTD